MVEILDYIRAIKSTEIVSSFGKIIAFKGTSVEVVGVNATIGELCLIHREKPHTHLLSQVVGFDQDRLILMPLGGTDGIKPGATVESCRRSPNVQCSDALLGRVIDPFGSPLDNGGVIHGVEHSLIKSPINPLERDRISHILETNIPLIDGFLTIGRGQRLGIFAGSGVGKTTLINELLQSENSDINVIALIGERGREAAEFIESIRGTAAMEKTVVIIATSEQPALMRVFAAFSACAIAEYFCAKGKNALLAMDSVTRLAMAQREVGLAAGEPPTSKGYTPSCFNLLPMLVERAGVFKAGGSITAYFTVLVEGDDLNDPIADHMRAILDGHIVLDRDIASHGRYPAINLQESVSRIMGQLVQPRDLSIVRNILKYHSLYQESKAMIQIGAYSRGDDAEVDKAIYIESKIVKVLYEGLKFSRDEALSKLNSILESSADIPAVS